MANVTTTETTIYTTPSNIQYAEIKLLINEKSGSTNTLTLNIYKSGETTAEKTIEIKIGAYDTFDTTLKILPGRILKGTAAAGSIQVEPVEVTYH